MLLNAITLPKKIPATFISPDVFQKWQLIKIIRDIFTLFRDFSCYKMRDLFNIKTSTKYFMAIPGFNS